MKQLLTPIECKTFCSSLQNIGFIPTMGALHEGHVSLIKKSVDENPHTVVSIFVNPTQFNQAEDYERYPNTRTQDLAMLEKIGVDAVFMPNASDIYPEGDQFTLKENSETSRILEGAHRPGHLEGVLTVLMKLFNLICPTRVYMGEKDYQQYLLTRDMTKAFFMPIEVIPCPTVRANTGLALSSRNMRLNTEQQTHAALLHKTLHMNINDEAASKKLFDLGFTVDYFKTIGNRRYVAAHLENVRLIDNIEYE